MKNELRKKFKEKREKLELNITKEISSLICKKISNNPLFKNAKTILAYHPIHNEVSIIPLIESYLNSKTILLPISKKDAKIGVAKITDLKDLTPGKFNILEPKPQKKSYNIDLVLVPGVVFDTKGNRIGFGKGYFDRFLKNINCSKIGIAYDFQILPEIPSNPHDIKMDLIISENQTITPQP